MNQNLRRMKRKIYILGIIAVILICQISCKHENELPNCEITSPQNGSEHFVGDDILISVDADDSDGEITEVRIYADNVGISSNTGFPYTVTWQTGNMTPGTYEIKATATDDEDEETSDNIFITLNPISQIPTADFTGTPLSGTAPLTVSFTDNSTNNPDTWSWSFGDGSTSTDKNPIHTYSSGDEFDVSLTVSNNQGSDTETKNSYVIVSGTQLPPVANFEASPSLGEAPLTVSFNDLSENSPTSWQWDFGDGSTSTNKNPNHTYNTPGTYTVSLLVENAYGEDTKIKSDLVAVIAPPPTANFVGSPTFGDHPLTVSFTNISSNNPSHWEWDFGDGETSNEANPTHTYEEVGVYSVSLTVSNSVGSSTETRTDYITATELWEHCPETPTVTDIDGNVYTTVLIGDQCWMQENLKVTHFPNGDTIHHVVDNNEWLSLGANWNGDAYCYYENNLNSDYGILYNWPAAIADNWEKDNEDGQGICPDGWHLPLEEDWEDLIDQLGSYPGRKMMEVGVTHWDPPNTNATNESGFTALPAGYRAQQGTFHWLGSGTYWWAVIKGYPMSYQLTASSQIFSEQTDSRFGYSVRCLKND